MTGERTIWLIRHAPASARSSDGERRVQSSSLILAKKAGLIAAKSKEEGGLGLNLAVMGVARNKPRHSQTAQAMASHLPNAPKLIEHGVLSEVDLKIYDPDLTREKLMDLISQGKRLPEFIPIIGNHAIKRVYQMDERIEVGITSGTKSVCIQSALQEMGALPLKPPSYKYLMGVGITLERAPTQEDPNAVKVLHAELKNL